MSTHLRLIMSAWPGWHCTYQDCLHKDYNRTAVDGIRAEAGDNPVPTAAAVCICAVWLEIVSRKTRASGSESKSPGEQGQRTHLAQYWTRGLFGIPRWIPALFATKHWLGMPRLLSVARFTSLYSSAPTTQEVVQPPGNQLQ